MYIDFQQTIWSKLVIPKDLEEKALSMLQSGSSIAAVINFVTKKAPAYFPELREDTAEIIRYTPGKDPTVEVYVQGEYNEEKCIWTNQREGSIICPYCDYVIERSTPVFITSEKDYVEKECKFFCTNCRKDF